MDTKIIEHLTQLTDEERDILHGKQIKRGDYSFSDRFIVNSAKFLGGRELDLRPHTRFIDFPDHGHDYMEFMYLYAGQISHIIGKDTVTLERGDILFLNRHARHSIKKAGQNDIGINFIISNPFLQAIFPQVENNPVMSEFLTNNFDDSGEAEYLYFHTRDCFPIRNLMDNLIYAIVNRSQEIYAGLVSMLFTYLSYYRETLVNALRVPSPDTKLKHSVVSYLESHFPTATLTELSDMLGYTQAYLSRRIHTTFGMTFQQLLQNQRLIAAEKLLRSTSLSVGEIARTVGYENQSYFYRIFLKQHGISPHKFRKNSNTMFK